MIRTLIDSMNDDVMDIRLIKKITSNGTKKKLMGRKINHNDLLIFLSLKSVKVSKGSKLFVNTSGTGEVFFLERNINGERYLNQFNFMFYNQDFKDRLLFRTSDEHSVYISKNDTIIDVLIRPSEENANFDFKVYSKNTSDISVVDTSIIFPEIIIPYHNYLPSLNCQYGVSNISFLQDSNGFTNIDIEKFKKTTDYIDVEINSDLAINSIPSKGSSSYKTLFNLLLGGHVFFTITGLFGFIKNNNIILKYPSLYTIFYDKTNKRYIYFTKNYTIGRHEVNIFDNDNTNIVNIPNYRGISISNNMINNLNQDYDKIWLSLVILTKFNQTKPVLRIPLNNKKALTRVTFLWSMGIVIDASDAPPKDSFNVYVNVYQKDNLIKSYSLDYEEIDAYVIGSDNYGKSVYESSYLYDDLGGSIELFSQPYYRLELVLELKKQSFFGDEIKPIYIPSLFAEGIE